MTIRRVMWKLGAFGSLVVSILCYGSEFWGYQYHTKIEQVHINFCKLVLGVRKYASNSAVLSECGRLPRAKIHQILAKDPKWIMPPSHGSAMRKCVRLTDKLGTTNWVTKVKRMLFSYGYGCVWLTQSVGDETRFLNSFRLRIEDNFRQELRFIKYWLKILKMDHDSFYTAVL